MSDRPKPTVHVAGAYSGGLQHCVICGMVLVDNRGRDLFADERYYALGPVTVHPDGFKTAGAEPEAADCRQTFP